MNGWTAHDISDYKRRVREGKEKPRGCNVEVSLPTKNKTPNGYNQNVVREYYTQMGLPEPRFEYRFHPKRKWRFDIAFDMANFPSHAKIAVEVQGGIWIQGGGRHNRGAAMLKEWEKLNTAAAMGWRVLFCQPKDVCTEEMVNYIKNAMEAI